MIWCVLVGRCRFCIVTWYAVVARSSFSLRKGKQCVAYYWGMQLQIPRRLIMVGGRLRWVASGAAVLLGNATADS